MEAWAGAITVLMLAFLFCTTYLVRYRMELRSAQEKANSAYLAADLKTRNEETKLDIEKQLIELSRLALKQGHSVDCSYCGCGYSKRVKEAEEEARKLRAERKREA